MTNQRCPHDTENPYALISRETLQDRSLSWEAKGLWAYLTSREETTAPDIYQLTKKFPGGRFRLQRMLRELRGLGLIEGVSANGEKEDLV